MKHFKVVFKYSRHLNFLLVISFLACIISVGLKLYIPIIIGNVVDNLFVSLDKVSDNLILIVLFILISIFTGYLYNVLLSIFVQKTIKNMRDDVYSKLNNCSISYIDSNYHGDLLSRCINDVENVSTGLIEGFASGFEGLFTIIFSIAFMFTVNYALALLVIFVTPVTIIVSRAYAKRASRYFKEKADNIGRVSGYVFETVNNYDLIRSYNYIEKNLSDFALISDETRKSDFKATFTSSWINPATRLINNIIYSIVILCGSLMTFNPFLSLAFSLGNLSSFLAYTNQYMKPFNEISNVISDMQYTLASLGRIEELLSEPDEIDEGKTKIDGIDTINVNNINFGYVANKYVIHDYSFNIKKGEKIALVGPTGCGKTTIINLLMRFYDPTNGNILVNNVDSLDITKRSLRKSIGMVLQDTWIFKGTVLDNIKYSKMDATFEDVVNASKKANADGFISRLPNGYETEISMNSGLSSGEMQLICIARMMLIKPEFIILDEATSNIDTRTEIKISKAFDGLMNGKTSIVIAHRLSTIKSADRIIVMKDGRIIEEGRHEDLINQKGFYYSLYMAQFE